MDTSSAAAECVTLMAAAGYAVHTFPTGQGNVIGNPIVPVIKISGNPRTVRTMAEHIDLDVSGILRREQAVWAASPSHPVETSDPLPLALVGWAVGCTLVWSSLFAIGQALYGQWTLAAMLAATAVASGTALALVSRRLWPDGGPSMTAPGGSLR
jgi:hypothetical protein